jgi:hypothetical protein
MKYYSLRSFTQEYKPYNLSNLWNNNTALEYIVMEPKHFTV